MNIINIVRSTESVSLVIRAKKQKSNIFPKLDSSLENHMVIYTNGPNTKYAKTQMWKVVHELMTMFDIRDEKNAIDIVVDNFAEFNLNKEECINEENLAMFRISCWKEAKKITKRE